MSASSLPKLIAIIGPTASGKTDLGIFLGLRFNGEIVSADSKQVYRGMDIGTAKEKNIPIPQHLIDIKDPEEKMTVGEYQGLAYKKIDDVLGRDKVPLLVGGSGLYVESVTNGYIFGIDQKSRLQKPRYEVLKMGLQHDRAFLKERAVKRLQDRLSGGLIEEVEVLLNAGVSPDWLFRCGLEYRYISEYLLGKCSLEDATLKIEIATNQFIKRQYTWWRRHADVEWVESTSEAEEKVKIFLGN